MLGNNIDVTFSIESIDPKFIVIKAIAKKGFCSKFLKKCKFLTRAAFTS